MRASLRHWEVLAATMVVVVLVPLCLHLSHDSYSPPAPPRGPVPGPGPAPLKTATPADRSLPVEQYVGRDVPSPDRPWTSADFARAAEKLVLPFWKRPIPLPRADSPRSGPLFARLVRTDDLEAAYREPLEAVEDRMRAALQHQEALRKLSHAYESAFRRGLVGDTESVALRAACFRLAAVTLDNSEEFLATFPPDDPKLAVRRAGLDQARRGIGEMLEEAIGILTARYAYRPPEREKMLLALREVAPRLYPHLPPAARRAFLDRLVALRDEPDWPFFQRGVDELRDALRSTP